MARGAQVRLGSMLLVLSLLAATCGSDAGQGRPRASIPTPDLTESPNATATPVFDPSPTPTHEDEPSLPATVTREPEPTGSVEDSCAALSLTGGGGATRSAVEAPINTTLLRADSWVSIGGFRELVWASNWIIRARVMGCEEGSMGFIDYTVEVQQTYRGEPRPSFALQGVGDRYGGLPMPAIGDELMLFIGSDATWVMGGPQGTFSIEDGLVGAEYGSMRLTPAEFSKAIAVALSGDPPENLPVPLVTLDQSPRGPDLPTPPLSQPAGCGGELMPGSSQWREMLRLLWSSQHVFAGTVIEQLPSMHVDAPEHETDPLLRPVVTDYLVRIEDPIRGLPDDVIRIRRLGGAIDGCLVANREGQLLEVGQRALFFVWAPEPDSADPTYYLNGGSNGFWNFADGEALAVQSEGAFGNTLIVPMRNFAAGLLEALQAGPPEDDGSGTVFVPLEAAPAAPPVTWPAPTPPASTSWVTFHYQPFGVTFDLPDGWSTYEDTATGTLSAASYATAGGDWESIPDGALRIDIERLDRQGYSQTPMTVGRDGLPGSISGFGLVGNTYHVAVINEINEQRWLISGYFKEPADLANPHLQTFFAIVASIAHNGQ